MMTITRPVFVAGCILSMLGLGGAVATGSFPVVSMSCALVAMVGALLISIWAARAEDIGAEA